MKMQRSNFESALKMAIYIELAYSGKTEPMNPAYFGDSAFLAGLKAVLAASKAGEQIEIVGASE